LHNKHIESPEYPNIAINKTLNFQSPHLIDILKQLKYLRHFQMNLGSCKQKIKAEIVLPFHFRQLSSGTLSLTFFHQFFTLFRAVVVLSLRPALFNELSVRSLPALKGAARGGIGGVALTLQLEFALCHRCPCALLAAGALNMPQ